MDKPLVTIGLLTYNHEAYIADTLEGLLFQKYRPMELIILDDASNDKTSSIIEQYMERIKDRFVRVLYIKNEKNCGNIPHNCNCIIEKSEGKFYFEMSGDDILLPQGIELLCQTLQNNPNCLAIHANAIQVQDTYRFGDKYDINSRVWKNRNSEIETDNLFQRLMYGNCILAPTVMVYREIFYKYGYHDESIAYEDYEYWLRISLKEKFYFLNKPVLLYRKANTSITNFNNNDNYSRLQTAIDADFLSRKKYISLLEKDEQLECWQSYYTFYIQKCKQFQYLEGIKCLEERSKKDGVVIDEHRTNYMELYERVSKEADILATWLKIKMNPSILGKYLIKKKINRVAIYGYSRLGIALQNELLNSGVLVEYVIDRKGKMLKCPYSVYTIEDSLPFVDAIIVTPVGIFEEVKVMLNQKTNIVVLELSEILEDLRNENELKGTV